MAQDDSQVLVGLGSFLRLHNATACYGLMDVACQVKHTEPLTSVG